MVVVREWVAKAENDLLNASHTLKLGERCPTDTVCFHAQQAAEKYLKALLTHRAIDFPRSHDLVALAARLRNGPQLALSRDELAWLTRFAIATRYPGEGSISHVQARRALAAAKGIRKAVRALLPRKIIRRTSAIR